MATIISQRPTVADVAQTAGGKLVGIITILAAGSLALWTLVASNRGFSPFPAVTADVIFIGALLGSVAGGWQAARIDPKFKDRNFSDEGREKLDHYESRKDFFLFVVWTFTAIYIAGLLVAIHKFPVPKGWWPLPLSPLVTTVTFFTIGFQMYFAVRYASFVKMLVGLASRVSDAPGATNASGKPPVSIETLRRSVFRDEQLYEPPGNVFVTMGITATFLGLAVGLATLDLTAVIPPLENATDVLVPKPAPNREGLSALSSFIGCMGLALGVSMLGVVIAMAAQWLRGHGPSLPTDILLERAQQKIDPPATSN